MTACIQNLPNTRLDTTTPVETTTNNVDISSEIKTPIKKTLPVVKSQSVVESSTTVQPPPIVKSLSVIESSSVAKPATLGVNSNSLQRRPSVKWKGVVDKVNNIQKAQRSNSKSNSSQWSDWSDSDDETTVIDNGKTPATNGIGGSDKRVHPALNRRTSTWSMLGRRSGYNVGGVIVPMLHTNFKSPLIEALYQDYYSHQYGYCVILLNVIAILVNIVFISICLSTEASQPVRFVHIGLFIFSVILRITVCMILLVKYSKKTRRKAQVASFVTWFLLTFQVVAEGIVDCVYLTDYALLFHHLCQMLYTIFVTYTLTLLTSSVCVVCGVVTSLVYVVFIIVRMTVILEEAEAGLIVRHVSIL